MRMYTTCFQCGRPADTMRTYKSPILPWCFKCQAKEFYKNIMTKFNYDLSKNPYSSLRPLTKAELELMRTYLSGIELYYNDGFAVAMPLKVHEDMYDIGMQLEKKLSLSDKQMVYIMDVYKQYVLGLSRQELEDEEAYNNDYHFRP
jgi:hypothetical protein